MDMRQAILIFMVLALVGTVMAQDLSPSRQPPVKEVSPQVYDPPEEPKQGGDTVNDAFPIYGLPTTMNGTTTGYTNDYDYECPFDSWSPDVVYSYTPANDILINVDLCGSFYDTKTFIFNADLEVIACNDDFYYDEECGIYVSKIEGAFLAGGGTYFIVIDGYGGDHGEYLMNVTEFVPCAVTCPFDAMNEGEPTLHDGYVDVYNSGCSSPEFGDPFQAIDWINVADGHPADGRAWLCGKSGWFLSSGGMETRDTDWFRVFAREDGLMEFTVESELPCYIFKLAPLDCAAVAVELQALADCEQPVTLSFPVAAGEEVWLWVGPSTFNGPVTEFDYFMTVSNNLFDVVPAEKVSWGEVKSLYR
jgi:hypothetical protein